MLINLIGMILNWQSFVWNRLEIKTPIALIQGYAEGLKEGVNEDAESREFYCDVIMDEASKMNQMVKNLLTLNQLEFGDEDIVFERFNLTALVKGVLQSMETDKEHTFWTDGYFVCSVGNVSGEMPRKYIENQG